MTAITQALNSALLHFLWQGVAVAFVLWVALWLLRRNSATARYLASCAALALMALLPVVTAIRAIDTPAAAPAAVVPAAFVPAAAPPAAAPNLPGLWIATLQTWAVPVWSIGVLLLSFRLVWGCLEISRLRRRGATPDEGLRVLVEALAAKLGVRRAVRVLIAKDGESPSVIGWIRPVLLLPAAALLGLTTDQLESVLAHELAHIRRHDYLVNVMQMLVETLLFYHPAVWWVSGRIRHERELCCDDLAVRFCGDAVCYARALTRLERLRITAPQMAMGSNSGSMLYRVQRVLGGGAQEYAPSKLPGILALALGLACFGLNIHWARGQEARKTEQPQLHYAPPGVLEWVDGRTDDAGVTVDLGGAVAILRERIEYPRFAVERRIEGTVTADVTLDGDGTVADAHVVSGPPELRRHVLQSVLNWRFTKAYANAALQIRVRFDQAAAAAAPAPARGYSLTTGRGTLRLNSPAESAEVRRETERLQRQAAENREREVSEQRMKEQLEETQRQREVQGALQGTQDAVRENQLKLQMLTAQADIVRLGRLIETPGPEGTEQARHQLKERETQLRQLALQLDAAKNTLEASQPLAGRTLVTFMLHGAVDVALLPSLGIQVGDVLTDESMKAVVDRVRQFDPRLEVRFLPSENNGASLRITGPEKAK